MQIIVLNKGVVTETGTFDELMSSKKDFSRLLEKHLSEEQRKEEEKGEEEDEENDKTKEGADSAQVGLLVSRIRLELWIIKL